MHWSMNVIVVFLVMSATDQEKILKITVPMTVLWQWQPVD
jgi:hypothetical protein